MADTIPTGLHTPVTNIPPAEATVSEERISPGDSGFSDEVVIQPGAAHEVVANLEAMAQSAPAYTAPDTQNLRDIGEASFGPPAPLEAVIGTDERVQIRDTTRLPWRLNASLLMTAADNSQWIGTGWFISPRTLVTAGHCVYIKGSGVPGRDGFVKRIQVMPGRNGTQVPFGGLTATEFWTVKGWAENGLETYDYGALILPAPFPQNLGTSGSPFFSTRRCSARLRTSLATPATNRPERSGSTSVRSPASRRRRSTTPQTPQAGRAARASTSSETSSESGSRFMPMVARRRTPALASLNRCSPTSLTGSAPERPWR